MMINQLIDWRLHDRHEVVSGYYCVLAYFFGKFLFDVLPQRLIPINLFAIITFFMIG